MAENRHDKNPAPHTPQPDITQPENRHERKDVDVYSIGKFAIGLVLTALVCIALMAGLFQYFLHRSGGQMPSRISEPNTDARQLPPEPLLEKTPAADLKEMRDAEDNVLSSYRWIDQSAGIVGLPIDRAMDLIAQRGLPVRANAAPVLSPNVTIPTESSLGPKLQAVGGPLANPTGQPMEPPAPEVTATRPDIQHPYKPVQPVYNPGGESKQ